MIKNTKYILIYLLILISIGISACVPFAKKPLPEEKNNQTTDSHISKVIDDNLSIDADVDVVENKEYNVYHATFKEFQLDTLKNIFMPHKKNLKEYKVESGAYKNTYDICIESNESTLSFTKDSFGYSNTEYAENLYVLKDKNGDLLNDNEMKKEFPKSTLSFMTTKEAVDIANAKINELVLEVKDTPKIYSLDKDNLNRRTDEFMTDEELIEFEKAKGKEASKMQWTKEKETYLLVYGCEKDNIPIHDESYYSATNEGFMLYGSKVLVLVNKSGVVMFNVEGMYELELLNKSNIISVDEALMSVEKKYKNIILTDKTQIHKISLKYLIKQIDDTIENFTLVPTWVFDITSDVKISDAKDSIEYTKEGFIYINATTGEEIL